MLMTPGTYAVGKSGQALAGWAKKMAQIVPFIVSICELFDDGELRTSKELFLLLLRMFQFALGAFQGIQCCLDIGMLYCWFDIMVYTKRACACRM